MASSYPWLSSRLQLSSLPTVKCESPAIAPPAISANNSTTTTATSSSNTIPAGAGDGVALFAVGGALLLLALLIVSCLIRTCRRIVRSKPPPFADPAHPRNPPPKGGSNPAVGEWNNEGSEQGHSPSSEKERDPFGA